MTLYELALGLDMGLIYGMIALGIYITFRLINFSDLTCDGSFVLGAAVCGILIQKNVNPWICLAASAASGALAGGMTGFLHTKLKISDLLSGILIGFMLYSVNLRVMGNVPNISLMDYATVFTQGSSLPLWVMTATVCFGISWLLMTDFGLALRSIGQNKPLAQVNGIPTGRMILVGLALSNALIALGGALFAQHQGFADVGSGMGTVVVGLAAVMIGEKLAPSTSAVFQVVMCIVGSIVYRLLISVALHGDMLGLTSSDLNLITGVMIIGITSVPSLTRRLYVKA